MSSFKKRYYINKLTMHLELSMGRVNMVVRVKCLYKYHCPQEIHLRNILYRSKKKLIQNIINNDLLFNSYWSAVLRHA